MINTPLAHNTQRQVREGNGPLGATYSVQRSARDLAKQLDAVGGVIDAQPHPPSSTAALAHVRQRLHRDINRLSAPPRGERPVTLGIGEPFTATLTVTMIFALILSLPVLLLQAYGYLMPAFEPEQRRRMLPVTLAIPLLFALGVMFSYWVVLPGRQHRRTSHHQTSCVPTARSKRAVIALVPVHATNRGVTHLQGDPPGSQLPRPPRLTGAGLISAGAGARRWCCRLPFAISGFRHPWRPSQAPQGAGNHSGEGQSQPTLAPRGSHRMYWRPQRALHDAFPAAGLSNLK